MKDLDMNARFRPKDANTHYEELEQYSVTRTKEISGMSAPYIKITDRCGRLVSRLVLLLGTVKPHSLQDAIIRDLMADVFDFLYESRPLIMAGKLNVAFPLARRAYESLSLLHLCAIDKTWAVRWHEGKEISNGVIRKELAKHPMGQPEEIMREAYKFFCSATHPNRVLIPQRFLGEGNQYVLGVIGEPDLLLIVDYCMKTLAMWIWLLRIVVYFYRSVIAERDKDHFEALQQAHNEAKKVHEWLVANYSRLLGEFQSAREQPGAPSKIP